MTRSAPRQHRSWISARDPEFAARAARVLSLLAGQRPWAGTSRRHGTVSVSRPAHPSARAQLRRRFGPCRAGRTTAATFPKMVAPSARIGW